ncbi:MAG: metallophosphatase family protein [Verrucomicrobia subdivision 3 bacterium]|nr:metallophosphatase family protein [Limisphaerales bacterium]
MLTSTCLSRDCPQSAGRNPVKYAVLGDIHANLEALTAVLEDARAAGCTHHACVGDIVGYNANPKECLETIREIGIPCVKGNHDEYSSANDVPQNLNPRAKAAILWTRQKLTEADKEWLRDLRYTRLVACFSIVHATLDSPRGWGYVLDKFSAAASFTYQTTSVCFFGHTHVPRVFMRDSVVRSCTYSKFKIEPGCKYFVNVGSVGEPRDGNPLAAYVIYDISQGSIELRRVPFDVDRTEAKLREAGLPGRAPQIALPRRNV